MDLYRIELRGCDDSTYVDVYLDEKQLKLINLICDRSEENSTFQCMPIMEVETIKEQPHAKR